MYIDICVCVYIRRTIERRMKVHTLCACVCCPNKQQQQPNLDLFPGPSADVPVRHSIGSDVC